MRENKTSVARMHCDVDFLALSARKFAQEERTEYQYITLIMRKWDILNTKSNDSKTNDPSILLVNLKFFKIITSREILNDYSLWWRKESIQSYIFSKLLQEERLLRELGQTYYSRKHVAGVNWSNNGPYSSLL